MRFYNKRDVWPRCEGGDVTEAKAMERQCWSAPEVAQSVNANELGDLKLTDSKRRRLSPSSRR
ncbi:MAG: hypothetical protein KDK26_19610 [Roseivivax sp.]|nr:hypothetical protein [Roseivivax sp.]